MLSDSRSCLHDRQTKVFERNHWHQFARDSCRGRRENALCDCAFRAQKYDLAEAVKRTKAQPLIGLDDSDATDVAPSEMGKEGGEVTSLSST